MGTVSRDEGLICKNMYNKRVIKGNFIEWVGFVFVRKNP